MNKTSSQMKWIVVQFSCLLSFVAYYYIIGPQLDRALTHGSDLPAWTAIVLGATCLVLIVIALIKLKAWNKFYVIFGLAASAGYLFLGYFALSFIFQF